MIVHLKVIGIINVVRSLGGIALAGLFLYYSDRTRVPAHRNLRLEEGDLAAFTVIGWAILAIALVRGWQGVASLFELWRDRRRGLPQAFGAGRRLSRRVGLGLSVFDLVNITLFPLSTACGLYGVLVYRHPEIAGDGAGSRLG